MSSKGQEFTYRVPTPGEATSGSTGDLTVAPDGDPERPPSNHDPPIALFLGHEENRRRLAEWLSDAYDVTTIESADDLDEGFSLCIIDHLTYARHKDRLSGRKAAAASELLPFLLVSPRDLTDFGPAVWDLVDEVISTPVGQAELKMRIDGMLERRRAFASLARRKQLIEALHDATGDMVQATDPDEVCGIAVATAERALDLPITAVWLADERGDRLVSVAQSDECESVFGALPTHTAESESPAWRAFSTGETLTLDGAAVGGLLGDGGTGVESGLVVPIEGRGVLVVGSTDARQFDDHDVHGVELLAANTAAALERAERERKLAEQRSQMEFFHSIIRHDVLNGMTVIQSRADALVEELEDDQLRRYAETIQEWSTDVTDVVHRVRSVIGTLMRDAPPSTTPVDVSAMLADEVARLRRAHPEVQFDVSLTGGTNVVADDILVDVFKNILTNAIVHNDSGDLRIDVTLDEGPEFATVRIADNGAGIPDDRKEAIFRRGETAHAKSTGSGFGLFFADTMIDEYGGDVHVEDNDPEGSVFVVRLPLVE